MDGNARLIFLLYSNRSGSTFLASRMDTLPGARSTIEINFVSAMIEAGVQRGDRATPDAILSLLRADPKFADWSVDLDRFRACLAALPRPLDVEAVARAFLHLQHPEPEIVTLLLKEPRAKLHVDRIRQTFRDPRFLVLVRDPRAVASSQTTSRGSTSGYAMAADPLVAARRWCRENRPMLALEGPDTLRLLYEDLVTDPESVRDRVAAFAGHATGPTAARREAASGARYADRIPAGQRHLHTLVQDGTPRRDRIDAWRERLTETDIHLVQTIAKAEMACLGYKPVAVPAASRSSGKLVTAHLASSFRDAALSVRSLVGLATKPRRLADRIRRRFTLSTSKQI